MLLVILDLLFILFNIIYVILCYYFNTAHWKSNVIEVIPFSLKLDDDDDDDDGRLGKRAFQ